MDIKSPIKRAKDAFVNYKNEIKKDKMKLFKSLGSVIGILAFIITFIWFLSISDSDKVQNIIESAGVWAPLAFLIFFVLSQVFAPISGTPAILLSFSLFGLPMTILLTYIAGIISSIINFYISRLYGRKMVQKFTGERVMKEIDSYVEVSGSNMLWLARIVGFTFFEFISYAAGLTNISFKKYIITTIVGSLLPAILFALLDYYIGAVTERGELFFVIIVWGWGLIFALLFRRLVVKTKEKLYAEEKIKK
ncbi:MAG: TVP38/TMEM64 family protein [Candidatus Pacearchaeota archaeon]